MVYIRKREEITDINNVETRILKQNVILNERDRSKLYLQLKATTLTSKMHWQAMMLFIYTHSRSDGF